MYNQITLSLYIHVRHIQTYYYISINIYIYTYTHIMYNIYIYIYSYLHYKSISLSLSLRYHEIISDIIITSFNLLFFPLSGPLESFHGSKRPWNHLACFFGIAA